MVNPTIVLASIPNISSLKECRPNLMPFHINYSGLAPISTYLIVESARETVGAPSPTPDQLTKEGEGVHDENMDGTSEDAKASCSGAVTMETDLKLLPEEMAVPPSTEHEVCWEDASRDITAAEVQDISHNHRETHLPPCNAAKPQPIPTVRLPLAKRVTDATTRFISSFRGRTIQGLKVELPRGYVGVVLKADGKLGEPTKVTRKARDDMKGKGAKSKWKGRSTRNSARVIDVDAEEENNMDEIMDVDEPFVDPAAVRSLVPVSQFSSFVLWHADHPVDEGRDEYFRSLTEWTRLAHEVCPLSNSCPSWIQC
jgi:ribonuclease H2 subunit C